MQSPYAIRSSFVVARWESQGFTPFLAPLVRRVETSLNRRANPLAAAAK